MALHGGVSPRKGRRRIEVLEKSKAGGPEAHPKFRFHDGSVIANPQITLAFWGDWSDADHRKRAERLQTFVSDLLASNYMNILSQYGVGNGAGDAGEVIDAVFANDGASSLSDRLIQRMIQQAIDAGTLRQPGGDSVLIIFLANGIGVTVGRDRFCEPKSDTAFGYHGSFTTTNGNGFAYAVIPSLDDRCVKVTCGRSKTCSLSPDQTQLARQTQVTSHELSEMTTNPFGDGWFDDAGDKPENGDICNGEAATINVNGRRWNVQRMYSKVDDDASAGANICVVAPQQPLPRLSG